jgi:hypothetical protein
VVLLRSWHAVVTGRACPPPPFRSAGPRPAIRSENPDSGHTGTVSIMVRVRPGQQERHETPDPMRSNAVKAWIQGVLAPTTLSRRGPPSLPPSRSTTRWARPLTRPGSRPRSGPRHPARAALQAPAGAERLGQPHGDRDQDRRVRRGGAVQPGDRGPAAAIPPDRRHARLPHPQEAQRQLADRHSQGIGPAHHPAEVTQPGSGDPARKQASPGTPRPGARGSRGIRWEL